MDRRRQEEEPPYNGMAQEKRLQKNSDRGKLWTEKVINLRQEKNPPCNSGMLQ
jgi:hypothetical protein